MENLKTERLFLESLSSSESGIYDIKLLDGNVHIGYITIGKKAHISYYIEDEYRSTSKKINRYTKEAVIAITKKMLENNLKPTIQAIQDPFEEIKDKSARIAKSCGYKNIPGTSDYNLEISTVEEYEKLLEEMRCNQNSKNIYEKYKVNTVNLKKTENIQNSKNIEEEEER